MGQPVDPSLKCSSKGPVLYFILFRYLAIAGSETSIIAVWLITMLA